jgi:hypothetical protein
MIVRNLKHARESGNLAQFIAEHENEIGDADALESVIRSMAGTSKEAPAASPQDGSGD